MNVLKHRPLIYAHKSVARACKTSRDICYRVEGGGGGFNCELFEITRSREPDKQHATADLNETKKVTVWRCN